MNIGGPDSPKRMTKSFVGVFKRARKGGGKGGEALPQMTTARFGDP